MSEWAKGSWIKIKRAKQHIRYLDAEITLFKNAGPYRILRHRDAKGEGKGDHVWAVWDVNQPDPMLGVIIGEAVVHLRNALDIVVYQLAWTRLGRAGNPPGVDFSFPIVAHPHELPGRLTPIQAAGQDIVDLITSCKPYKSGNEPLYVLNKLANADKHKVLVPTWKSFRQSVDQGGPMFARFFPGAVGRPLQPEFTYSLLPKLTYPVKEGTELYRVPAGMEDQMDMEPVFLRGNVWPD